MIITTFYIVTFSCYLSFVFYSYHAWASTLTNHKKYSPYLICGEIDHHPYLIYFWERKKKHIKKVYNNENTSSRSLKNVIRHLKFLMRDYVLASKRLQTCRLMNLRKIKVSMGNSSKLKISEDKLLFPWEFSQWAFLIVGIPVDFYLKEFSSGYFL